MSAIASNLQAVQTRINQAAITAGRSPDSITLLAVSKTWPLSSVIDAADAGQRAFGENYVQEGVDKINAIPQGYFLRGAVDRNLCWHFIGPLQSNKTRLVAEHFDWVHSIERLKIAERLSSQRPQHLPPLQVCLQVNVSGEASKSGCAPAEAPALALAISRLPGLKLRGLMAIPEPADDFAAQSAPFRRLRAIYTELQREGLPLDTLSMGMSHDLEAAIAEGATIVRIGTAIFGERNYT
jgi:pyridoxal phosphate enzyme (YggS family)